MVWKRPRRPFAGGALDASGKGGDPGAPVGPCGGSWGTVRRGPGVRFVGSLLRALGVGRGLRRASAGRDQQARAAADRDEHGQDDRDDARAGDGERLGTVAVPVVRVGVHRGVLAQGAAGDGDLLEAFRLAGVAVDGLVALGPAGLVAELVGDGAFDERGAGDLGAVGVVAALGHALEGAGHGHGFAGLEDQGVPVGRGPDVLDLAQSGDGVVGEL